jgi:hypothetical protein
VEKIRNFSSLSLCSVAALLFFAGGLSGETIHWSSPARGGDTHFSNPVNWNKGKVPQRGDTAVFDSTADGSAACNLDSDPTICAIIFRDNYTSLFDFNGHFLTISGDVADFRSNGEIDGAHNRGGIIFAGSALQHFLPGKAHFPCIIIQGTDSQTVICHGVGMLADTLILNGGTLFCGEGLVHLCGEIRGKGGSLDFGSSSINVFGAGIFLSRSQSVSARTGALIFTGSDSQHIELPRDTTTIHAMIQNCGTGCVLGKSGLSLKIDSLTIKSGFLTIADSQCLTVGALAVTRGGLKIPKSGCFIVQKSADLSGLDTGGIQGRLGFSGEAVTLVPRAGVRIPAISLVRGKVILAGRGCDVDELQLSNTSLPCTLSLGSHLTNTVRRIFANTGSVIDFGTSTLRFEGDTLDFSLCGIVAGQLYDGAISFSGTKPQVFVPNKIAGYPSIVQNGTGGTTVCKNGFTCRRLTILSGMLHCGTGLSHTITNLFRARGGGVDFGSSTVNAAADTIDLTGVNTVVPGSGTLSFIGAMGTQIFMPNQNVLLPDLAKSQNGTVRVTGALRAKKFWMSAGTFDPGDARCELSGFSAKGGTLITGRDSMIITGNANFSGLSDLVAGKAPVVVRTSGDNPVISFSSTVQTIGHLVLSARPSPEGAAKIIAGKGIHRASRLTFQWNRSADSAIFDFRQNNAGLVAEDSVDVRPENSGIDKGAILMGNGSWTFSGDVVLRNYACDSSTVIFNRRNGRQTINAPQPFNNIMHSGSGALVLSGALLCRNFTQSSGILDFRGSSLSAENDVSLLHGPASSIAVSPFSWKISAGRNTFLSGSPDSPLAIGSASACTLSAGRSLTVRYGVLKHCAAVLTKGTAYNSSDSGDNDNWSFINKPLPINISATNISFGSRSVGTENDTIATLSNLCGDTVIILSIQQVGAAFRHSIEGARILPRHSVNDTILYSPNDAGPDSGSIIYITNAESSPDTIVLRGTGRGPRLHRSCDTISFGTVSGIKPLLRTIVFKNTGTDTLQLSQNMQPADENFSLDSAFWASPLHACAPQDSCIDTVRFFPKKTGFFSAFLMVKSNCRVACDTVLITARSIVGVQDDQKPVFIPKEFAFQEVATLEKSVVFKYCLPATSKVTLEIYDAIGRFLERPVESIQGPAEYQYTWDASHLSRGIYFCRLKVTDLAGSENRFFKTIRVVFSK